MVVDKTSITRAVLGEPTRRTSVLIDSSRRVLEFLPRDVKETVSIF